MDVVASEEMRVLNYNMSYEFFYRHYVIIFIPLMMNECSKFESICTHRTVIADTWIIGQPSWIIRTDRVITHEARGNRSAAA